MAVSAMGGELRRGPARPVGMRHQPCVRLALVGLVLLAIAGCAPGGASPSVPTSPTVDPSPTVEPSPSAKAGSLEGIAVAGPTCPVVTDPPQSGCEARPVEGARLAIVDEAGDEVATATTGADGRFQVDLAPGTYEIQPQPVEGLMHTAAPVTVNVPLDEPAEVTISYDTGIR